MMKLIVSLLFMVWLLGGCPSLCEAQEIPTFTHTWDESQGLVVIPAADLPHFGETVGHFELDWTPGMLIVSNGSQQLLDIPNHLAIWIYEDGIHGEWFDRSGNRRLFRTRWGLPAVGVEIQIAITWNSAGYAVIVDGILRIHDWQVLPTTVYPDIDIVDGYYGASDTGSRPGSGSFEIRFYDGALSYDACSVDTVGTINETVPYDNLGSWSQGIDPACGGVPIPPDLDIGEATLSWTAPTQNDDGTPLTDLAGFMIYYGIVDGGPYGTAIQIVDETQTTYTITGLAVGTYYFVSTAYNSTGTESVFSNQVSKLVEAPPLPCEWDESIPADDPACVEPPPPSGLVTITGVAYGWITIADHLIVAPVGTVPVGTQCDTSQSILGKYVVPRELVTWSGNIEPLVVLAECG